MDISRELIAEIVEHARREAPDECCGLIAIDGDTAVEVFPGENVHASPYRFEIDPRTLLKTAAIEDSGHRLGVYHSHTRSEPYPSQTDINQAALWPGSEWLIVGLADGEPEVRSFLISDGEVQEVGV